MQTVIIVIHLMVVAALVVVVLLQRSEGGALGIGGGGGGGGFFTGRGQANALTRATAVLATIFFLTSIALTVIASMNHKQKSIFEGGAASAPTAPAGTNAPPPLPDGKGGLLENLQKMQDQKPAPPAIPPAPTGPQVPKSQ